MDTTFDCLINGFIENKVGLAENFLTESLAVHLRANLLALHSGKEMKAAGIGNNAKFTKNELVRSDKIYWLDREHNDVHENSFFDLMDEFVIFLNRTCYAGITGYEFHYALYEKGSFYKRHLDQFKDNSSRAFSMIMYLNEDWKEGDGGELCIYHEDAETQNITPSNGRCVFFKSSELEHEVLMSHQERMSITGWLKRG